ncbi:MAG: response regulator [Candidatus Thiodiazotropha sp. (ex Dulcina madagascariensis)]|nr:response regulator [Candidatus Thiodiazotropha sp. (ex Dulcina madagascariensis)]MCU7927495.1 response regulator [Candidatus Thiodiazotropha sp. (ex Dulcina madagascariensis)]
MYRKPWKRLYLSPGETAEILKVTPASLRGWTSRGLLCAETTQGGHRRYPVSEVLRLAQARGLGIELPAYLSLRVLVIDADVRFSHCLQEVLEGSPEVAKVAIAHSGFIAGSLVAQFRPDFVLLDLKASGIDGFEVCRFIKHDQQTKFIRIIAMSRLCADEYHKRIVEAGAEACLLKPFPLRALKRVLGLSMQQTDTDEERIC